ncbi:MAG: hypothetical protein ACTHNU_02805 [Gaiellales bacterium]
MALCRALEDFIPRRVASRMVCPCALFTDSISVTGILRGRRLAQRVDVNFCSACGLGGKASADVQHAFRAVGLS